MRKRRTLGMAAVAALAASALAGSPAPRPGRVRVSVVNADLAAIVQRLLEAAGRGVAGAPKGGSGE